MGARKIIGKNGIEVFTDTALEGYAKSFADFFAGTLNLYDCGKQGIGLGLEKIGSEKARAYLETISSLTQETTLSSGKELPAQSLQQIRTFLESEEKALNRIKELLMFGRDVASCSCSLEDELHSLIAPREYLFLHFPDGYKCDTKDLSFLKRIRGQIDFFLKDIKNELKLL